MLKSAFGSNTAQIKEYLGNPENQFDPVMTNDAFFTEGGTKISRADFDSKELHLSRTFDLEKVPAAYNTVVLTKLLMMEPSEVNRLMHDLGSSKTLGSPRRSSASPGRWTARTSGASTRRRWSRPRTSPPTGRSSCGSRPRNREGPHFAFSVTSAAWPPFRSTVTGSVSSPSEPGFGRPVTT